MIDAEQERLNGQKLGLDEVRAKIIEMPTLNITNEGDMAKLQAIKAELTGIQAIMQNIQTLQSIGQNPGGQAPGIAPQAANGGRAAPVVAQPQFNANANFAINMPASHPSAVAAGVQMVMKMQKMESIRRGR